MSKYRQAIKQHLTSKVFTEEEIQLTPSEDEMSCSYVVKAKNAIADSVIKEKSIYQRYYEYLKKPEVQKLPEEQQEEAAISLAICEAYSDCWKKMGELVEVAFSRDRANSIIQEIKNKQNKAN